jgi:hypothetical protein
MNYQEAAENLVQVLRDIENVDLSTKSFEEICSLRELTISASTLLNVHHDSIWEEWMRRLDEQSMEKVRRCIQL